MFCLWRFVQAVEKGTGSLADGIEFRKGVMERSCKAAEVTAQAAEVMAQATANARYVLPFHT